MRIGSIIIFHLSVSYEKPSSSYLKYIKYITFKPLSFSARLVVCIIHVNRKRRTFVSFGHSPQIYTSKFRSTALRNLRAHFLCYIASSKHGWEPIRARVTCVLFYNVRCNISGEAVGLWLKACGSNQQQYNEHELRVKYDNFTWHLLLM